jgi:hypothetical protein
MKARFVTLSALVVGVILAACGGGAESTTRPVPCPLFAIPAPPQLVSPAPGATSVPDGNFSIQVSFPNGNLASEWSAPKLVAGNASVNAGPYVIAATTGPAYEYTSAVGALSSATAYSVQVVNPPAGGACSTTATLGSFATQ